MKNLILIAGLVLSSTVFSSETKETVLSEVTSEVEVELNKDTVKCSQAGYSLPFLKILIPELGNLTIFDHRNFGEGAPCVAAGQCSFQFPGTPNTDPFGSNPDDIIDILKPTETIQIKVTHTRVEFVDDAKEKCTITLREDVLTNVRGVDFRHMRSQSIGQRQVEDCL